MEFVDPGGDDMVTGFADLLHRRDSQMEGITDPESACGTDMQASIAANLDLEPISRSELVDGTTSDPFGVTCKQPMYPSSDRTRRILRHGSQLEVGNAGTDPRMDLRARAMPRKMSSIKLCMLNSEGKHTPDTFAPVVGMPFNSCQVWFVSIHRLFNLIETFCSIIVSLTITVG
ncbi:hypothetical protein ACQJBY_070298 [Aegilops geniculata]